MQQLGRGKRFTTHWRKKATKVCMNRRLDTCTMLRGLRCRSRFAPFAFGVLAAGPPPVLLGARIVAGGPPLAVASVDPIVVVGPPPLALKPLLPGIPGGAPDNQNACINFNRCPVLSFSNAFDQLMTLPLNTQTCRETVKISKRVDESSQVNADHRDENKF